MRLQDRYEKYTTSDQLTIMTVEKHPVDEESEVPTIDVIPANTIDSEKIFYHGVYVMKHTKDDCVNRKDDQVDMDPDPYVE